jgi:hypothetical protein
MRQIFQRISIVLLMTATLLLGGCRSDTESAPASHLASLEISGSSEADILRALKTVFEAHGYQHIADLAFDKKGSAWQTALYGGWNADGVWIRLKASLDLEPSGLYLLGCDAFRVTNHNQGVMEEEKPTNAYREECRKILEEVRTRLASGETGSGQS